MQYISNEILKDSNKIYYLVFLSIGWLLYACNPVRFVPKDEYLLRKNIVILDTNALPKDGLESLIKQQPNKKLFGILYPYVWFYQKGSKGKENGFKRWLKEIGEVPAILDTSLTNRSSNQIQLYMEKHGFFNAVVKDTVITDRQYANVFYNIYCGKIGRAHV